MFEHRIDSPNGGSAHGRSRPALLNGRELPGSAGFGRRRQGPSEDSRADPLPSAKRRMRSVFRALSAIVVAVLMAGTFFSYRAAVSDESMLLVSGVLGVITLIFLLHVLGIDRRIGGEPDPALKAALHEALQADLASKIQAALSSGTVKWEVCSPEVHRVDAAGLARARAMSGEGESIDGICRALEPDYAAWSPPHQAAFRNVMQAALDQG